MNTHLTLDRVSRATRTLAIVTTLSLLAGCAGVTITKDDGTTPTGIPVRMPQPYLLVTLPLEEGKPVQAQIIALPTGEEIRLKPKGGLGSASLKFELTNGALSSWGLDTDSKVPETITAVSGMATGLIGALKKEEKDDDTAATKQMAFVAEAVRSIAGKAMIKRVEELKTSSESFAKNPSALFTTAAQIELFKTLPGEIGQLSDLLASDKVVPAKVTTQLEKLRNLLAVLTTEKTSELATGYEVWRLNARAIFTDLGGSFQEPATPPETIRLYRIKENGTLERVL